MVFEGSFLDYVKEPHNLGGTTVRFALNKRNGGTYTVHLQRSWVWGCRHVVYERNGDAK